MAINPNPQHSPRHVFLCGTTGSGKSSFLRRLRDLDQFRRVILWDPDHDHAAAHYSTQVAFKRAVMQGIASGDRFRVAYSPASATAEEFEFWCAVLWAALDGNVPTAAIVEELADVTGSGKAKAHWGQLSRKSRKYGGVIYSISQRPSEIDKTILNQSAFKWCGVLETDADRRYMSGVLSVTPDDLARTPANVPGEKCHYWLKRPGPEPAQIGDFNPVRGKVTL